MNGRVGMGRSVGKRELVYGRTICEYVHTENNVLGVKSKSLRFDEDGYEST